MTAHHTRRGAGHVGHDPVVRAAVPPRPGCTGIGGDDLDALRAEREARQILSHARNARCIAVERGERGIGELGDMRRLAARRGARVEHAHAVGEAKQRRRELCAQVLHRKRPLGIAGQLRDRPRRIDDDPPACGRRIDAGGGEAREQSRVFTRRFTRNEWWSLCCLPPGSPASRPANRARRGRSTTADTTTARPGPRAPRRRALTLAQIAAQHRVDERLHRRPHHPAALTA
jgi:hypothetical protein